MSSFARSAARRQVERDVRAAAARLPVADMRREESWLRGCSRRLALERRDVAQHVDAASVSRDYHVVPTLRHHDPCDRRRREPCAELLPVTAIVQRIEEPVARPREQHPSAVGVLGHCHDVVERSVSRQVARDVGPRLSEVRRLVHVRLAVVHDVEIDRNVGSRRIEVRRLDLPNRSPRRKSFHVA